MKKLVASLVALALMFLVLAAVLIATGHATTTNNRPNTLGASQIYTNPYTYLLALPIDGQILEGKYTNIRFQPYATANLYDESVLFCGDVADMFNGKHGPVVVTYRTQASRLYKGSACHALLSVFEVTVK